MCGELFVLKCWCIGPRHPPTLIIMWSNLPELKTSSFPFNSKHPHHQSTSVKNLAKILRMAPVILLRLVKDISCEFFQIEFYSSGGSRGRRGCAPPWGPTFFNFMQFSGNFDKIICWRPPPPGGVGAPLLGEILDLPLYNRIYRINRICRLLYTKFSKSCVLQIL